MFLKATISKINLRQLHEHSITMHALKYRLPEKSEQNLVRQNRASARALRVPTKQQSYDFMARDQTFPSSFFCCFQYAIYEL